MTVAALGWQLEGESLQISGRLTASQVPVLAKAIPTLAADTVVDLGQTERVDSAGVALLLSWAQTGENPANNAALPVRRASGQFLQLVDIFNLGAQFAFVD